VARYHKLGYVAINVSDVARSARFYERVLGLQASGTGPRGEALFRCSNDHHNIVLCASNEPGLKRLGWEMESDAQLDVLERELQAADIEVVAVDRAETDAAAQGRAFRIVEPHIGVTHEFYNTMRRWADDFVPTVAKIQRLGHVVLRSPNAQPAIAFLQRHLNFRISDTIGERATFMRCFPNPYHHSLAVAAGPRSLVDHINFMVSEIDDIGAALARFKKHDVTVVWGPGRHPPSGSVFLYFLDPDGITLEYSFGMETFPEVGARNPHVYEPIAESFDFWGSELNPRKGAVGAIEPLKGVALAHHHA
jgi:2,3-dihydroxy-p-cumate/2,3-dihydroxybenzoate 3,4-dioxygenase